MLNRFLSGKKKFLAAIIGMITAAVASHYPVYAPFVQYIAGVAVAYIAGESFVDVARAQFPVTQAQGVADKFIHDELPNAIAQSHNKWLEVFAPMLERMAESGVNKALASIPAGVTTTATTTTVTTDPNSVSVAVMGGMTPTITQTIPPPAPVQMQQVPGATTFDVKPVTLGFFPQVAPVSAAVVNRDGDNQ